MSDQDERKRYQWERTRRMKGIILGCAVGNDVIIFQHRSVSLGLPRSIDKSFCKWRGDRARERYWEQYYTHIWGASGIFPRSSAHSPNSKQTGPWMGKHMTMIHHHDGLDSTRFSWMRVGDPEPARSKPTFPACTLKISRHGLLYLSIHTNSRPFLKTHALTKFIERNHIISNSYDYKLPFSIYIRQFMVIT